MVTYSEQAAQDLEDILYGLVTWGKHPLSFEHATEYANDIRAECSQLDKKYCHFSAKYDEHLQYGNFVFSYKRNSQTTWYVIYDIDIYSNIYIQKIVSNHLTKS